MYLFYDHWTCKIGETCSHKEEKLEGTLQGWTVSQEQRGDQVKFQKKEEEWVQRSIWRGDQKGATCAREGKLHQNVGQYKI